MRGQHLPPFGAAAKGVHGGAEGAESPGGPAGTVCAQCFLSCGCECRACGVDIDGAEVAGESGTEGLEPQRKRKMSKKKKKKRRKGKGSKRVRRRVELPLDVPPCQRPAGTEGLSDAQSRSVNARLILLLANHIGDLRVLREALDAARQGVAAGSTQTPS